MNGLNSPVKDKHSEVGSKNETSSSEVYRVTLYTCQMVQRRGERWMHIKSEGQCCV